MSTDSTDYSGSRSYKRRSGGGGWERTSRKVENLAHSLKDTNRNLKAVDKMLLDYKDASEQQNSVIDKLQGDVSRSRHRIRDEKARIRGSSLRGCSEEDLSRDSRRRSRMPTSPLRNYDRAASDHEFADDWQPTRNSVRFYDDMDTPPRLHRLHQSVRDVSSEQLRLEDDLQQEILRRHRIETDHNKTLAALLEQTKQADPALNSVEQRLQSIQDELRSERTFLRRKQDEVGKVSQELKQALIEHKQPANVVYDGRVNAVENEAQLRARLTQVETQKTAMESELERTKQRLEQMDGNKSTLITQVDDMRRQLSRVEHERDQLGLQLEQRERDLKAQLKTRSLDEQQDGLREQEIKRLKQDLEEARSQLTKSASVVGDYGELRRELDKSERLRSQLSDHIQVLNRDLEAKEKHSAKVIMQLQDVNERFDETERVKRQVLLQLEDSLKKLRDTTREAETIAKELKETQGKLQESEARREEIKTRAQETVRQWKMKCKRLERDVDRFKHSSEQAINRGEHLVKELEMTRSQSGNAVQQLEHLKREFSELLAIRAQQDEQVQRKDIQVNELKSLKIDLERDFQDSKMVIERMEHELVSARTKTQEVDEEKNRLEEQLNAMNQHRFMAENQIMNMQKEIKDLSLIRVEQSAQLAHMAQERQDVRSELNEAKDTEVGSKEEIQRLNEALRTEKEAASIRLDALHNELSQHKSEETQRAHELCRRFKKDKAEYEAELQALKIELHEEKSSCKLNKKQIESLKSEIKRLSSDLAKSHEDNSEMETFFLKAREDFITKMQQTEDEMIRSKDAQLELVDVREKSRRMQKDLQDLLVNVSTEIDTLTEVLVDGSVETLKALSLTKALPCDPQKWTTEMKSKMKWMHLELCRSKGREQKLRTDVREVVNHNDQDRQMLITEIKRQGDLLDQLGSEFSKSIESLPKEVQDKNLENDVDTYQSTQQDESRQEKDEINLRYSRLKESVNLLRNELNNPQAVKKAAMSKYRVDPPSPSPLRMTDEEFMRNFLPQSPEIIIPVMGCKEV